MKSTGITIINADADMHGASKENIFIAKGKDGDLLGLLLIYPFFDPDIEPEHPHNLYLYFHVPENKELSAAHKDQLLEKGLQRAKEIKEEEKQPKTRVYVSFLKGQEEGMAYFLQRGFVQDESMLILERNSTERPQAATKPEGVNIQPWMMETESEEAQFIAAHREIFPRHAYSPEKLNELKSLPGWMNFTAFQADEIAGNIMLYIDPDHPSLGIIEDLFVSKNWRRKGIAEYLLNTALKYFAENSVHQVQLELWSANKKALSLYEKFDFAPVDEIEFAVGRYVE